MRYGSVPEYAAWNPMSVYSFCRKALHTLPERLHQFLPEINRLVPRLGIVAHPAGNAVGIAGVARRQSPITLAVPITRDHID